MKNFTYTIFKTNWGYFALAADSIHIIAAVLPQKTKAKAKLQILDRIPNSTQTMIKYTPNLHPSLTKTIIAYFNHQETDFTKFTNLLPINNHSKFKSPVLTECTKIPHSQTLTYKQLAKKANSPNASRAVGNILASNKIPLLIPCHRVIKSDGKPGGFSAHSDPQIKSKLLQLEKN